MGESRGIVEELLSLCLQRITMEENTVNTEQEMVKVVKNFEMVRKQWLHAELELKKYKELLVKSDVAKAALEVKLKHARNQLDVEMKKRYKIEGDYQYLQRQMQLMCDILVHDSKSSACLNDEQKSLLATFEPRGANMTTHRSSRRLSVIDESSFLSVCHSDISYDRTDDDVDLDTSVIKPLRSRARERRRSSMGSAVGKRARGGNVSAELLERKTVDQEVETIVKASVITPDTRGQIHMVIGITQETPETPIQTPAQTITEALKQDCPISAGRDQTSVWFPCDETVLDPEPKEQVEEKTKRNLRHVFFSKTVIRPETCSPCGKRIRFGKMAVKCRKCRVVAHPECQHGVMMSCLSSSETGKSAQQRGLYRVPGGERLVKELRDRFLQGKTPLMLNKVQDIHVVCGLLKDFLRKLKEPLITFRLHRNFMEASELTDEHNRTSILYQLIFELPEVNRDTLSFLLLHLHKVMKSPQCQMDQNNLARVFGPTVVGHGMTEPSPTTIMSDTNIQPKVMYCLLSLPEAYWKSVLATQADPVLVYSEDGGYGRLFKPLTSPEMSSYYKSTSRGSLRGRIRNLGNAISTTGRIEPGRKFFTSPS